MTVHIVRLGSARLPKEGLRLGTVRWLPRGVPKSEYASRDLFDVWFPLLAPSAALVRILRSDRSAPAWRRFRSRFRAEMRAPEAAHCLELLAVLSQTVNFSVGCYCADATHCHRSILRELLAQRGAKIAAARAGASG